MATDTITEWVVDLFQAIDAMDTDTSVDFLTNEAVFVYGSGNPVTGKENITSFLAVFYGNLTGIVHRISGVWECDETTFVQTTCTYTMKDSRDITILALNLFNMEGHHGRASD